VDPRGASGTLVKLIYHVSSAAATIKRDADKAVREAGERFEPKSTAILDRVVE
jgi:hypothetical protein